MFRFHRRSIRLKGYDYTHPGAYFITLVTSNRLCLFGEIRDGQVKINQAGEIVRKQWERLPSRFPFVRLGHAVIMPNHFHGILIFDEYNRDCRGAGRNIRRHDPEINPCAPTVNVARGSLGAIVRSFKSAVTMRIHFLRGDSEAPVWQRNYYEHIIRDETEWLNISQYIMNNPGRWQEDRLNSAVQTGQES